MVSHWMRMFHWWFLSLHIEDPLYLDTLQCCWFIIVTLLAVYYSHENFAHNHLCWLRYTREGSAGLGQTRGVLRYGIFDIACQNKSYEIILLAIWGTVVIWNLQFWMNSEKK